MAAHKIAAGPGGAGAAVAAYRLELIDALLTKRDEKVGADLQKQKNDVGCRLGELCDKFYAAARRGRGEVSSGGPTSAPGQPSVEPPSFETKKTQLCNFLATSGGATEENVSDIAVTLGLATSKAAWKASSLYKGKFYT